MKWKKNGEKEKDTSTAKEKEKRDDWTCPICQNLNFGFRMTCNRCQSSREEKEEEGKKQKESKEEKPIEGKLHLITIYRSSSITLLKQFFF